MRGVLLTGLPGVGKSTACRRVAERCRELGFRVEGFITEEIRQRGARIGFDVIELRDGLPASRCPLARVGNESPRVGKYSVSLQEFESLALPVLDRILQVPSGDRVVCIVDEIGKMELLSTAFVNRARALVAARPVPILFTIALHGGGFIAEAKKARGLDLVEIDETTRDSAPQDIVARLLGSLQKASIAASPTVSAKPARRWQKRDAGPTQDVDNAEVSRQLDRDSATSKVEDNADASRPSGRDSAPSNARVVVWLRNTLRLADNPLVQKAMSSSSSTGSTLSFVFCYDPPIFSERARTAFGSLKVGEFRRRFLQESLADLAVALEKRGSKLYVFDAAPEEVLPSMAASEGVVWAAQEACPEELSSEKRVQAALQNVGASFHLVADGGINTIFGPANLESFGICSGAAFPGDFQVFYNAVEVHVLSICRQGLYEVPHQLPPPLELLPKSLADKLRNSIDETARLQAGHPAAGPKILGGETQALTRMQCWLESGGLQKYKATFRRLSGDYSSRLSAHLALGCVAPQRVCVEAARKVPSGPHVKHFLYEMCWRDFFRHVARRWGSHLFLLHGPLQTARQTTWQRSPELESRLRSGTVGVPLVDAAMRELQATGFLGNLARQFLAAFIVEDLGLDWRVGADWFEEMLVDYDPHSNWGQWARSAGVAPTNDAKRRRVGGTRYFDIALGLDEDEAANYIRAWVPELADISTSQVIAPWLITDSALNGYPRTPMCSAELRRYFEEASRGRQPIGRSGKGSGGRGAAKGGYRNR